MLRASVLNFERLDILQDSIEHPSKKLLSFEFSHSFCIPFRTSWYITGLNGISELKFIVVWICSQLLYSVRATQYITGLNRISELKVILVCICYKLPFSITSVSIYYGTQSDIRVKSYCCLNLLTAFVFNFERLNILRDLIGHPS